VINLKDRPDRLKTISERLARLGLSYEVLEAVSGSSLPIGQHPCPPNVAACWLSHQLAAVKFLETTEQYALILEDDAEIEEGALKFINNPQVFSLAELDIFQLGYNVQNDKVASGHRDSRLRLKTVGICKLDKFVKFLGLKFKGKCPSHRMEELLNSAEPVLLNLFETGTHGYVISRDAAEVMRAFNNPVILPADIALCEISLCENIQMARPVRSLINQDASISSIPEISNEALERKLDEIVKGFLDVGSN